jgi:hypothetical protein
MPHIIEKLLTKAKFFLSISSQLKVCIKSYGPPKLQESQCQEFRDSHVESPGTKWHLGVGRMAGHNNTIKGGRWWPPPSSNHGESVFAHGSFVHKRSSNYALTNLSFGLCKAMWIIDPLIFLLDPIPGHQHAPLPLKCYELQNMPQLVVLLLFPPLDS